MNSSLRPLPLDDVMQIVDRRHRRRAKTRAAAGSAVAVAGLGVAGIVGVYVSGDPLAVAPAVPATSTIDSTVEPTPPNTVEPSVPPPTTAVDGEQPDPDAAFTAAGYSDADAVDLAQRWNLGDDIAAVRAEAGRSLAAGVVLADGPRAEPAADDGYTPVDLEKYFYDAGYVRNDAITLAKLWVDSPSGAAARAGSELMVVGVLPAVDPLSPFDAFIAAGCTSEDGEALARFWGLGDSMDAIFEAKTTAGGMLLAGKPLPTTDPPLSC